MKSKSYNAGKMRSQIGRYLCLVMCCCIFLLFLIPLLLMLVFNFRMVPLSPLTFRQPPVTPQLSTLEFKI